MRAALRHLCQKGEQALKPQKVVAAASTTEGYVSKPSREVWRRPVVGKRVANDLRKAAIRSGTYGSFCSETGIGWEPSWDLHLVPHRHSAARFGRIRPSKRTARERNREDRARKLEENLLEREAAIEEHYSSREEARVQDKSFEARMKRMARGSGGGGPP